MTNEEIIKKFRDEHPLVGRAIASASATHKVSFFTVALDKLKAPFRWLAWKLYGKRQVLARQKYLATVNPPRLTATFSHDDPLCQTITEKDVIVHGGDVPSSRSLVLPRR